MPLNPGAARAVGQVELAGAVRVRVEALPLAEFGEGFGQPVLGHEYAAEQQAEPVTRAERGHRLVGLTRYPDHLLLRPGDRDDDAVLHG
jgi:hypothetical protein